MFLPGYDEIITLRDRIQEEKRFSDSSRLIFIVIIQLNLAIISQ